MGLDGGRKVVAVASRANWSGFDGLGLVRSGAPNKYPRAGFRVLSPASGSIFLRSGTNLGKFDCQIGFVLGTGTMFHYFNSASLQRKGAAGRLVEGISEVGLWTGCQEG